MSRKSKSNSPGDEASEADQKIMSLQEFAADFAYQMTRAGYVADVGEDGAVVSLGWPDWIGAEDVDMERAYARYLKKLGNLDAIMDRLCTTADRKMPDHTPRGWGS